MYYNLTNRDGSTTISVFLDNGTVRVVAGTSPTFQPLLEYLTGNTEHSEAEVERLVDPAVFIGSQMQEVAGLRVTYDLYNLFFDQKPLHSVIAQHIKDKIRAGDNDWKRLVKFLLNLDENPSYLCQQEVYGWVQRTGLTLTEDGHFLGYKAVREDHESISSGPDNYVDGVLYESGADARVPHEVGSVISKKRADVDDTPGGGCSVGLHVGTYDYAKGFGPVLMTVKVNPRDVVSVPSGDSEWKIRVCRYEVVELNEDKRDFIGKTTSMDFADVDDALSPEEEQELHDSMMALSAEPEDPEDPEIDLMEALGSPQNENWTHIYSSLKEAEEAQDATVLDLLRNVDLGHKPLAQRLYQECLVNTTESSIRRWRKSHGVS